MATRRKRKGSHSFGSRTDVGCVREHNEDSLIVSPPLFVVCDGMGGHAAGEVASEIAVNVIAERAPDHPDAAALGQAVEEANLAIIEAAREGAGRAGMGTTATAAIIENERLVIAQVGDSRAYLLHQGKLNQLTRDHSLVADLVEAGEITPEQARVHPQRSVITRALGTDLHTQPDLLEINVHTGDRLLLCSDGLTSMLEDDEIESILKRTADPQLAAAQLVNAAIGAGGYDNVTVVVVEVTGFAEERRKKIARRTKVTAISLIILLALVLGSAAYAFNYWTTHAAYITEQDGKVAVYQGVPGNVFGLSFNQLVEVTDIELDELQPGLANRIESEGIRTESVKAAQDLVEGYRSDILTKEAAQSDGHHTESSAADAANAPQQGNAPASTNGQANPSSNQGDSTPVTPQAAPQGGGAGA